MKNEKKNKTKYLISKSKLFRWCVSAVSTRQNQIVDENKKPILAMIPFLDMCNHDFGEVFENIIINFISLNIIEFN